jgi:hypothetical protein
VRRAAAVVVGTSVGLVGAGAGADPFSAHGTVAGYVAATDNVLSAPDDSATVAGPTADVYTQVRPGLLLAYEQQRAIYEATAELEATAYASDTGAWTLSAHLGARAFFLVSPRTEANLGVDVGTGRLNALTARNPAQGTIEALPTGAVDFRQLSATQGLSFTATPELRLSQGLFARATTTASADATDDTETLGADVGGTVGADRTFKVDAVGLQLGASWVALEQRGGAMPAANTRTRQLDVRGAVTWRHDLNARWSSAVDVGAAVISTLEGGSGQVFQPTYGAALGYTPDWGSAGVSIRRSVVPNLLLAQNTITDALLVNVALPLPYLAERRSEPQLSVQGTAGAIRSRLLDLSTGEVDGVLDTVSLDAALVYEMRRNLTLGLRYQLSWQLADDSAAMASLGFRRNTVMFEARYRWPERLAGEIPDRSSLRVDRSDLTVVGDEAGGTSRAR